jgi:hypothetical protein
MSMESHDEMILIGENTRTRSKPCPRANLSTTNPTWTDKGANQGHSGERPTTNHLSHGTAFYNRVQTALALFLRVCVTFTDSQDLP